MKKTAFLIMLVTIISKVLGFGRDVGLSYFFGASSVSDAYLISLTVPGVIFGFIGMGIIAAYIPMQVKISDEHGIRKSSEFTSNFINIILLLVTVLVVTGLIFTENIVKVFAVGFVDATLQMAIEFTRISLFGIYFSAIAIIFSGYLQVKKNFLIPASVGIVNNIIIIIFIMIASRGNYYLLAIGTLLALVSQVLWLVPFVKKEGFKYVPLVDIKDEKIKEVFFIAVPMILGTAINQINLVIDRTIASSIVVGGISALNYANRLDQFVQGLFVGSIITVIYPKISTYASDKNFEGIKKLLYESINTISVIVIPLLMGAMAFSVPVVSLLFGRGEFDQNAIILTSSALFFYSFGMLSFGLINVFTRVFYSMQNTKTPMIIAAIGMMVNIVLNIILSKYMGIAGLALATSLATIFISIVLFMSLINKLGDFDVKGVITTLIKITGSSLIMVIVAKVCYIYCSNIFTQNVSLIGSVIIGIILYCSIIYFMKIEDVDEVINFIKFKIMDIKVK